MSKREQMDEHIRTIFPKDRFTDRQARELYQLMLLASTNQETLLEVLEERAMARAQQREQRAQA